MPTPRYSSVLLLVAVCLAVAQIANASEEAVYIGKALFNLPKGWMQQERPRVVVDPDPVAYTGFHNGEGTVWVLCSTNPTDSFERMQRAVHGRVAADVGIICGCPYWAFLPTPGKRDTPVIFLPSLQTRIFVMTATRPMRTGKELIESGVPLEDDKIRKVLKDLIRDLEVGLTIPTN